MKRTRRTLTEEQKVQAWEFKLASLGKPCVVCGKSSDDAHHAIEAQWLRRNLPDYVYDTDLSVPVCRRHHERHTSAMERIPRACLPSRVEEFAGEHDLTHLLERYYPQEDAEPVGLFRPNDERKR